MNVDTLNSATLGLGNRGPMKFMSGSTTLHLRTSGFNAGRIQHMSGSTTFVMRADAENLAIRQMRGSTTFKLRSSATASRYRQVFNSGSTTFTLRGEATPSKWRQVFNSGAITFKLRSSAVPGRVQHMSGDTTFRLLMVNLGRDLYSGAAPEDRRVVLPTQLRTAIVPGQARNGAV